MAEKEMDTYEKIEKGMKTTKKYVAKIRDGNYAAIKKANEAIDYKFENFDEEEIQDKYIKTLADGVREHIKKAMGIGKEGKIDDLFLDELIKELGGVTHKEISDIVKGLGSDFEPDEIVGLLEQRRNEFRKSHYLAVGRKYVTKKEDIAHALKYFGIKKDVREDIAPHDLHGLFTYGKRYLSRGDVPHTIRKPKKKEEAA